MRSPSLTWGELQRLCIERHFRHLKRGRAIGQVFDNFFGIWQARPLLSITDREVSDWWVPIKSEKPAQATRVLTLWRQCWTFAKQWGLIDAQVWVPGSLLKRKKARKRRRFVMQHEWPRLRSILFLFPPSIHLYFFTCILTGCRPGEARGMEWRFLDFDHRLWWKAETKTDEPQLLPLPPWLAARLAELPRTRARVFYKPEGYYGECWRRIREAAGLLDVQLRDLRRTPASWMTINRENTATVGAILNHSGLTSTDIYTRLDIEAQRAALNRNEQQMLGGAA